MEPLTLDMILVMAMIGLAIFLFIVEWVRVDVVAILMMVSLPLLHLVTPKEAFVGLSSNAVVSIIAVIIIGAGLDRTGMINKLVAPVLRIAGNSTSRIIIAISVTVAVISSFMQNIGAAALFLPAIQRISKMQKIPLSRLLMPIGFSAILGGTITLVGCSPLILLNDLLAPFDLEPFGLFDVTPIGCVLVTSGVTSFVLLGRFILPQGEESEQAGGSETSPEETETGTETAETYEVRTPDDFTDYRDLQYQAIKEVIELPRAFFEIAEGHYRRDQSDYDEQAIGPHEQRDSHHHLREGRQVGAEPLEKGLELGNDEDQQYSRDNDRDD